MRGGYGNGMNNGYQTGNMYHQQYQPYQGGYPGGGGGYGGHQQYGGGDNRHMAKWNRWAPSVHEGRRLGPSDESCGNCEKLLPRESDRFRENARGSGPMETGEASPGPGINANETHSLVHRS